MDPINPKPIPKTDEEVGQDSIGGTTTDPEADDNVSEAVGDYLGNTPQPNEPLNIAGEIDSDEDNR